MEDSELAVQLQPEPDIDDDELAELTRRLRAELLDLDVKAVEALRAGMTPDDSKGIGLVIGGLLVRVGSHPDTLRAVVSWIQSWLNRQRVRAVKLTLDGDTCEVTGLTSAEQERLIDLWIARHATRG